MIPSALHSIKTPWRLFSPWARKGEVLAGAHRSEGSCGTQPLPRCQWNLAVRPSLPPFLPFSLLELGTIGGLKDGTSNLSKPGRKMESFI